jgi:hypothetical protein
MEISYEVIKGGEVDDQYFMFSFKFSTEDFTTTVGIDEPYVFSRKRWMEFIQTIKNRGIDKLNFYNGNGYGILRTKEGKVAFEAMPSGAGGDVSVHFELTPKYADMMVAYLSEMIEHPNTKCMKWN